MLQRILQGTSIFQNITKIDGLITTVASTGTRGYARDGGPATLAQLRLSNAVATDTPGNLYIVDGGNERI